MKSIHSLKSVDRWLEEYGESHQNPTNKLIHWLCVPAITFSVIGLFWALSPLLTIVFMGGALFFYVRLSPRLALAMTVLVVVMLGLVLELNRQGTNVLFWTTLVLFVVAWIFQFIGHHIEGKKPSFFKDIQYLLIGPLWVICFLFRRLGIRY